ncbi:MULTISPECIES: hypothetical protein [Myxococcus]|uniref:hypothetical protein n=1 Tax=Myxococcus TaxID=32 RepID=UPI00129C8BF4|nr:MULTISPECIES: hypothetical protein [Myxococcus]NOK05743.1 hypothetical protein [Myxococcus xanthus]
MGRPEAREVFGRYAPEERNSSKREQIQSQGAKVVLVGRPNSGLPLVYQPDGR